MRAIVTGMIATYPVGGVVWDYAQYALGLEQLGWEVFYLEDTGWNTYDPRRGSYGDDPAYGVAFLRDSLAALSPSLATRWHFRAMDGTSHGLSESDINRAVASADLLLNVSGGTLLRDAYMPCPRKVLIDTDPGYNHFVNFPKWDRNPGWYGSHGYRAHDHFFTYAQCMHREGCILPDMGIRWLPTRPPVLLDQWRSRPPNRRWTTVMTWDNFREPITHQGVTYGTKERQFTKFRDLPRRLRPDLAVEMEVASGGDPPADLWRQLGWSVIDCHSVSRTLDDYRDYIQRSRGEFSVAKDVYVATCSGWFSCRSICYLAAGLPVVVQDTGFSRVIPAGKGLMAFSTPDEALAAIETVESDYAAHCQAGRRVAEQWFDARVVLNEILNGIGIG